MIMKNKKYIQLYLTFMMNRSSYSLEKLVKSLIDGEVIPGVTEADMKAFNSYVAPKA